MSTWPYPWVQALIFYYWGVHTGYRREHLDERESRDDSLHKVGA
ncbi:amino-acid permease [Caballeronia humi]|uniref:Amino-acid permease n=1 Tax=Caballeronia humi TaxID=326474 RepID=A0A158ISC0_9BURK|nr:amino-acid permease [Caballeronia humi]